MFGEVRFPHVERQTENWAYSANLFYPNDNENKQLWWLHSSHTRLDYA